MLKKKEGLPLGSPFGEYSNTFILILKYAASSIIKLLTAL
jgi:hypothetical protein